MRNKENAQRQRRAWKAVRLLSRIQSGRPGWRKWRESPTQRFIKRRLKHREAVLRREAYRKKCLRREARRLAERMATILDNARSRQ